MSRGQEDNFIQQKLEDDEEAVQVYRRHFFSQIRYVLVFLILLLLPFFLMFPLFQQHLPGVIVFFLLLFVAVLYGFRRLFIWRQGIFIISSKRVIDIDQRGFLHKTVTECDLSASQDVSHSQRGLRQTLLHLGNLEIQTDGYDSDIEMPDIFEPEKAQKFLRSLKDTKHKDKESITMSEALAILENLRFRLGEEKFNKLLKLVK